jgi:hypothetical protein
MPPNVEVDWRESFGGGVLDSSELGLGASVIETIAEEARNRGSRKCKEGMRRNIVYQD